MRFKLDENLPVEANVLFIQQGYDSETVHDENLKGCTDFVLFTRCKQEKRILITLDLDFSNTLRYPFKDFCGLIILRIRNQSKKRILDILQKIIPEFDDKPIQGHVWIVEDSSIRIR
jgi:predicted nuclease of predicted toxin-antitoxin system